MCSFKNCWGRLGLLQDAYICSQLAFNYEHPGRQGYPAPKFCQGQYVHVKEQGQCHLYSGGCAHWQHTYAALELLINQDLQDGSSDLLTEFQIHT